MTEKTTGAEQQPADVLRFWREAGPDRWFASDPAFDAAIRSQFLATYVAAASGSLHHWEATAEGALALSIVLDQFSRNMFRNDARAFAADPLARAVADRALTHGFDLAFEPRERQFFYLPFEHCETLVNQERGIALFRALGDNEMIKWAERHADVIRRFGRFPHRNAALGRTTTTQEQAFLDAGSFKP
jgi:uncharacterized protein (DUF924 family)